MEGAGGGFRIPEGDERLGFEATGNGKEGEGSVWNLSGGKKKHATAVPE